MVLRLRSRLRVGARLSAVSVLGIVLIDRVAGLGAFDRVIGLLQNEDGVLAVRVLTYWEHFQAGLQSSVIGLGTGATAVGSRYVAGEASGEVADIPLFVEVALAKVVADFSVIGLGVYLWLFARLVAASVKTHNRAVAVGAEETASFAAVMMAYQLLVLYFGYELAAAAIPLWFLSGAVVGPGLPAPAPLPDALPDTTASPGDDDRWRRGGRTSDNHTIIQKPAGQL